MEYIICALAAACVILMVIAISAISRLSRQCNGGNVSEGFDKKQEERFSMLRNELASSVQQNIRAMSDMLESSMRARQDEQRKAIVAGFEQISLSNAQTRESISMQLGQMEKRLGTFSADNAQSLELIRTSTENSLNGIRKTIEANLSVMRDENSKKLEEMRKTVDEKLQSELERRLKESFSSVSGLLERVQQEIGGMKTLAEDVGGLKRTLSNVKTRGMMGEFQLESILSDIFSPTQYVKDAKPVPGSACVVEFAVKIPTDDNDTILLPIDSKFPRDRYEAVLAAADAGDKANLERAIQAYSTELKREASDIKTKYIYTPYTTDYAIMFLPTESMYADAVNRGMLEIIWRQYRVYIAGPSTIAALLSSLQLAFNNIAIQKRAGEVFSVLSEVKNEFGKFEGVLLKMQTHLNQANDDLSTLMGTRTRAINKKLSSVTSITANEELALPVNCIDDIID